MTVLNRELCVSRKGSTVTWNLVPRLLTDTLGVIQKQCAEGKRHLTRVLLAGGRASVW